MQGEKAFLIWSCLVALSECSSTPCGGPTRGSPVTADTETLCAIRCRMQPDCSSYLYKDRDEFDDDGDQNEFEGNCVLRDKYEDDVFSEVHDVADYRAKHCIRVDPDVAAAGNVKHFVPPPSSADVAQDAAAAGFDVPLEVPSLKVTRFVAVLEEALNPVDAATRCGNMGGTLALEYNQEVSDLITAAGASAKRYVGAAPIQDLAYTWLSRWQNGLVDWTAGEEGAAPGSCPRYPDWAGFVSVDVNTHATYVDSDAGTFHMEDIATENLTTHVVCQYQGRNVAQGRPARARLVYPGSTLAGAVDGDWNQETPEDIYGGDTNDWLALDLGARFAVKRFLWRQRFECCGYRNRDMVFLVGEEMPESGSYPVDAASYLECATFPYFQYLKKVDGVTCDCLAVGSVAVVLNAPAQPMQLVELAVYAVPYGEFGP